MANGVYLAVTARLLVNLESLNMAESVGNITRHRKAPVVVEEDGAYRIVYVPVVSGMSLAHHYQVLLARAAAKAGLPVSQMSLQGYFLKYASDDIINKYYPEVKGKVGSKKSPCENERVIVESDVVADVGGFLYTDGVVKRTSRFSFSYMVPALEAVKAAGVYPQLHVRYTPEAAKQEQALIYVDNASALYTLSYILEASEVSVLGVCKAMGVKPHDLGADVRVKRVKAAVEALVAMLGNMAFGAKRSRSLPHWKVASLVAVASEGIAPFTPNPGHDRRYLADTLKRLEAQKSVIDGLDAEVHYYAAEKLEGDTSKATRHDTPEEAIKAAADWALKRLERG
ncbi:type I-A CRISPR-associated protein Cas7/Csa2 [Stetteria hydrogenophila]